LRKKRAQKQGLCAKIKILLLNFSAVETFHGFPKAPKRPFFAKNFIAAVNKIFCEIF